MKNYNVFFRDIHQYVSKVFMVLIEKYFENNNISFSRNSFNIVKFDFLAYLACDWAIFNYKNF